MPPVVRLDRMKGFTFGVVRMLLFTLCFSVANGASKAEFDAAMKQVNRDAATPAGQKYARTFALKYFAAVAGDAMQGCLSRPDTVEPAIIIFVVSADGKVIRILSTPGIKYGECVVAKLRQPIVLPRPPHNNFAFAFGIANHSHAEKKAPVDKPIRAEGDAAVAYDKAIAPYVAKAKRTYPAAKKRYLAGLPPGWRFCVSYRLTHLGRSFFLAFRLAEPSHRQLGLPDPYSVIGSVSSLRIRRYSA